MILCTVGVQVCWIGRKLAKTLSLVGCPGTWRLSADEGSEWGPKRDVCYRDGHLARGERKNWRDYYSVHTAAVLRFSA